MGRRVVINVLLTLGLFIALPHARGQNMFAGEGLPPIRQPLSVRYGAKPTEFVRFWGASKQDRAPLLIIFEDGGWRTNIALSNYRLASSLASGGIAVALISRRPDRADGVRAIVSDAQNILSLLSQQGDRRNIQTDRLAIMGVGSGAAPAALMATDTEWTTGTSFRFNMLRSLVLIDPEGLDPEATLASSRPDRRVEVVKALGDTPQERLSDSALGHLATPNIPDALVMMSHPDRSRQSEAARFMDLLKTNGVSVETRDLPRHDDSNYRTMFGSPRNPATQQLLAYLLQKLAP